MSDFQTPRGVSDEEYIRLTDLTKLRVAKDILYSVGIGSLPSQPDILRQIYAAIVKLEALKDV